jgi:maleate isomerase
VIASYGWRARIGVLQPSMVGDNNPYEFYLMAPPGVQLLLTSLGMVERDQRAADAAERALDQIEAPVKGLLSRRADVIIQAGIPLITRNGWGYEDKVRATVSAVTDVPFTMDVRCSINAMQALGASRIAIVAGFDHEQQEVIVSYLKNAGIDVAAHHSIPEARGDDQGTLPLNIPYRAARDFLRTVPNAQAVWMPGASIPTVGMIQALEEDAGVPVITSAQAMMWEGLRLAGVATGEVTGFGRLFKAG